MKAWYDVLDKILKYFNSKHIHLVIILMLASSSKIPQLTHTNSSSPRPDTHAPNTLISYYMYIMALKVGLTYYSPCRRVDQMVHKCSIRIIHRYIELRASGTSCTYKVVVETVKFCRSVFSTQLRRMFLKTK